MADNNEQEQELIQNLLYANIVSRQLDDDFADFIQELQETSQIDMSEYGYKQMKEWLSQFLSQRNVPLIGIPEEESPSSSDDKANNKNSFAGTNMIQDINGRSSSDESKNPKLQKDNSPPAAEIQEQQQPVQVQYQPPMPNPVVYNPQYNPYTFQNQPATQAPFDIDDSIIGALDQFIGNVPTNNQGNFADFDDDFEPFPTKQGQSQQQPLPPNNNNRPSFQQDNRQEPQQPFKPAQTMNQAEQGTIITPQPNGPIGENNNSKYPQLQPQNLQQQQLPQQQTQPLQQQQQIPPQPYQPQNYNRSMTTEEQRDSGNKSDFINKTAVTEAKKSFGPTTVPPFVNNQGQSPSHIQPQQQHPQQQVPINQVPVMTPAQTNSNQAQINNRNSISQNPDISMMPDFKHTQFKGFDITTPFPDLSVIGPCDEPSKFISTEEQIKLIEQFENQLKDREYLNASQIIECQRMEYNKIGKFVKSYPEKKPKVAIQSYRIFEEGFLKQNYVLYTVSLSELGWTCYRRYSDFKILRDIFENQYPGYFVPPLPRKNIVRKFEPEYLEKRMKILEQFMEAVLESELLRNSQYLEDFLFIQDEAKYRKVASNVKEGPIELNQFYAIDGKINCQNSTNFQTYGAAFRNYTQNLTTLYGKAKHLTKEVVTNLDNSQKSLKNLSGIFSELSKITSDFNQRNKIGVNAYLQRQYEENSKFLQEYSDFLEKQQKLFKNYIYLKMRYEKKVCEVFEDMSNKRNKLMASFQEAFTKLGQKKQKMFDKKDIKQWELPPNLPVDQMVLLQDSKSAFKYMLPRETQIVKQMNKKINFFNSNLFYETRKYLKIRETKISSDFIQFTTENGEHLNRLKEYHDQHLARLNQIVIDSQQTIIQQIEDDRKIIDQSINGTFLTDAQCAIRKVVF